MKILSVAVGGPREVEWDGERVLTSIFKTPVMSRVAVGAINIAGDDQSDRAVHGGPYKAVYAYPSEHYAAWRRELNDPDLPWTSFGENLTTSGLLESFVCIGDRYGIGSAIFIVSQPRLPCFKLPIRLGRRDMIERFASVDRSGFYFAVEQPGDIGVGDAIALLERDPRGLTVADTYRVMLGDANPELLGLGAAHPALAPEWRERFERRLASLKHRR